MVWLAAGLTDGRTVQRWTDVSVPKNATPVAPAGTPSRTRTAPAPARTSTPAAQGTVEMPGVVGDAVTSGGRGAPHHRHSHAHLLPGCGEPKPQAPAALVSAQ